MDLHTLSFEMDGDDAKMLQKSKQITVAEASKLGKDLRHQYKAAGKSEAIKQQISPISIASKDSGASSSASQTSAEQRKVQRIVSDSFFMSPDEVRERKLKTKLEEAYVPPEQPIPGTPDWRKGLYSPKDHVTTSDV